MGILIKMNKSGNYYSNVPANITVVYVTKLETALERLRDEMRRTKIAFIASKEKREQLLRESDSLKLRISSLFKTIRLEILRKNDELKKLQNKFKNLRFRRTENYHSLKYRSTFLYEKYYRRSRSRSQSLKSIYFPKKRSSKNRSWLSSEFQKSTGQDSATRKVGLHLDIKTGCKENNKQMSTERIDSSNNEFEKSNQPVQKITEEKTFSQDISQEIINAKIKDFEFECPQLITPIGDTPDYLKEKFKFLENASCTLLPSFNEFAVTDKNNTNLNLDDVKFIGNDGSELKKINILVRSPFKNCILMDVIYNCAEKTFCKNSNVSTSIDIEHKDFLLLRKKKVNVKKSCENIKFF